MIADLKTTPAGPQWSARFDSLSEYVEFARAGRARDPVNGRIADRRFTAEFGNYRSEYLDGLDGDGVVRCLSEPRRHTVEAVERMVRELTDEVEAPTRQRRKVRRKLESGDELDPQAWLERRIDGWSEVQHTRVPRHVVRVLCHPGVLGWREPQDLLWRGAAAVAVASILGSRGMSVEIDGVTAATHVARDHYNLGCRATLAVTLKRAEDPLDVGAMATALCEVAFHRIVTLAARARVLTEEIADGMGKTATLTAEESAGYDIQIDSDILGMGAAVEAVRRSVSKFAEVTNG